jgi:double-stranded uracil-DNA glycosylase
MPLELPDYLRPGLDIVFVGINPGEWAARTGHYYANPRNLFWHCLYESGLTEVKLEPEEDKRVLEFGMGLTDRVKRWTKSAKELRADDYKRGGRDLRARLESKWPRVVAFNGMAGLRWILESRPTFGRQKERFGGSEVFVLPATAPANARFSRAEKLDSFRELADWVNRNGR